jgi:hypothetical protein
MLFIDPRSSSLVERDRPATASACRSRVHGERTILFVWPVEDELSVRAVIEIADGSREVAIGSTLSYDQVGTGGRS